jgi:HSP20 family protein
MYTQDLSLPVPANSATAPIAAPSMNMDEDAEKYIMSLALPGLERENISVTLKGYTLQVETNAATASLMKTNRHHEYDVTHELRRFVLPQNADAILIHAFYTRGELTLIIPKGNTPDTLMSPDLISIAIY